jgi:hypothetical protein
MEYFISLSLLEPKVVRNSDLKKNSGLVTACSDFHEDNHHEHQSIRSEWQEKSREMNFPGILTSLRHVSCHPEYSARLFVCFWYPKTIVDTCGMHIYLCHASINGHSRHTYTRASSSRDLFMEQAPLLMHINVNSQQK